MILVGMLAAGIYALFVPRVSVNEVRQVINSSLPIGSSKENVKAWLKSQSDIRYSGEIVDDNREFVCMHALVFNTGPRLEGHQYMDVRFYFENGKLSRIDIKTIQTPFVL